MKIISDRQIYTVLKEHLKNLQSKNNETIKKQSTKVILSEKNINENKELINAKIQDVYTQKLLNILDRINPQDRALLINNILENKLTIDIEKIVTLVSYLEQCTDNTNKESIIRAFILLIKNQLPVNTIFIEGTAENYNYKKALTYKLNELQKHLSSLTNKQNYTAQKDNVILNILKQLTINPSKKRNELINQLKEYPEKLNNLIQILMKQSSNGKQKLLQQLIGQQIINHQNKSLLLQLELPLFFPQYNKSIPGYLNIKRDKKEKSDKGNPSIQNYRIDFIISLQKRGIIKAETYISNRRIKIFFTSNKKETIKLIRLRFNTLKKGLEKMGIHVEKPIIEHSQIQVNVSKIMTREKINTGTQSEEDFIHLDIKI